MMMVTIRLSMGKNQGKANKADNLVGVCYRSPNPDEKAKDDILYNYKI